MSGRSDPSLRRRKRTQEEKLPFLRAIIDTFPTKMPVTFS